ncbi:hypothetical protein [Actinoallomurus iriomotensis]|uniref:Uncharacterized protein n=1 Tax=Actinoallomurus iriomotensis TaxID=478107 RepID=A0A9W6VXH6_9ACTN|nr:hypothetical protein [Actinoallomurus iriomotensis]GLY81816.1 hypothetical protein Airi01_100830 [Actinoallomurus iriomotensis]
MNNSGTHGGVTAEEYARAMAILGRSVTTETPAPATPVPGGKRGDGLTRGRADRDQSQPPGEAHLSPRLSVAPGGS